MAKAVAAGVVAWLLEASIHVLGHYQLKIVHRMLVEVLFLIGRSHPN